MNRFFSPKFVVAASLAIVALGATAVAQARPNFTLSLGFGPAWVEPEPEYVQPWPVYVQPRPVFVQPAPVYARPPVFVAPREAFEGPRWGGYDRRYEREREREWRHADWRRQNWREEYRGADRGDRERRHGYRD